MSPKGGGGFGPARLTPEEWQNLARFFKDYLADNPLLRWAIILSGVGGLVELLHTGWLALRFVFRF